MRILFLTPWYPDEQNPNHGIFVRDQVTAIQQHHHVLLVAGKIDYTVFALSSLRKNESEYKGVREFRILISQSLPVFNQLNFFFRIALYTYKIGRDFKPDLIHANIGYPGAFWGWMLSNLLRVPYVLTEHTRITNNFRSWMHKRLTLFGLRKASSIVAVSKRHAEELKLYLPKKNISVIPNIVRFDRFPLIKRVSAPAIFHLGFLGGLETPVKGLDILLQAVASIKVQWQLHIGGKGALLEEYILLAKQLRIYDRCIFYGFVQHNDVPDFFRRLQIFISSSRYETFGLAMVEALATGLPVVASDSGGPSDFINATNGVIVERENIESLKKGIEEVMMCYDRYNPGAIRDSVVEQFSEERFQEQINTLYQSCLSKDVH